LIDRAAIGRLGDYYLCSLPQKRQPRQWGGHAGGSVRMNAKHASHFQSSQSCAGKDLSHDPRAFVGMIWLKAGRDEPPQPSTPIWHVLCSNSDH
jgi:hypothetical protein